MERGGDFIMEHPWPSEMWGESEVAALVKKYGLEKTDMCAFGLRCPDTNLTIRKTSDDAIRGALKT